MNRRNRVRPETYARSRHRAFREQTEKRRLTPGGHKTKLIARYSATKYVQVDGLQSRGNWREPLDFVGYNRKSLLSTARPPRTRLCGCLLLCHRRHKDVDDHDLMPEWSAKAMDIFEIAPRNWAYPPEALKHGGVWRRPGRRDNQERRGHTRHTQAHVVAHSAIHWRAQASKHCDGAMLI